MLSNVPNGIGESTAPWNREDAPEDECEKCREVCDDADDIRKGRLYGDRFLCGDHIPQCQCGEDARLGGEQCVECEIKMVYDMSERGELSQSETFEWIHELEKARREA